jgi:hypothetical protein
MATLTEQSPEARMAALVDIIARHQEALALKDSAFALRYKDYLGSAKTWTDRLRPKNFAGELRPEKWLPRLQQLVTIIQGGGSPVEEVFELPILECSDGLYELLQGQTNDRRNGFIVGPTGIGKTSSLKYLAATRPRQSAYVRILDSWRANRARLLSGIARAVGCTVVDRAAEQQELLISHLKSVKVTLLIDDAQEGGVALFKLCKTLIDETPVCSIMSVYQTAWAQLLNPRTDAHQEARQLLGRSIKPVLDDWIEGVDQDTTVSYVQNAFGWNGEAESLAPLITPYLRRDYNLRTLADACHAAVLQVDGDAAAVTPQLLREEVEAICPGR